MATNLQEDPSVKEAAVPHKDKKTEKRMIRLRPSDSLGDRLPAMHLVRSSWFARAMGSVLFYYLILFLVGAVFLPWQQSSRCEGIVTARNPNDRRQPILSPTKGIIKAQKAGLQEGTRVEKGEIIMEIEPFAEGEILLVEQQIQQQLSQIESTRSQLDTARKRVEFTKDYTEDEVDAASAKVESAVAKYNQAMIDVVGQEAVLAQAKLDFTAFTRVRGRTVSELEYQEKLNKLAYEEQMLLNMQAVTVETQKNVDAERSNLESKRNQAQDAIAKAMQDVDNYDAKLSSHEQKANELEIKLQQLKRNEIISPNTGWVQSIVGQVGRTVSSGETLFEMIPDSEDLWVELSVRGMDQPLVHLGDKVRIQFEGWPAIQFVGWPSVARGTFGGVVNAVNPADDGTGNFKIFVGPDPDDVTKEDWPSKDYLKQGVRANAWVLMDQVSLGFEIWRQVNGFPLTRELGDKDKKDSEAKAPKLK
jgi:multidrug resistance efflux pump